MISILRQRFFKHLYQKTLTARNFFKRPGPSVELYFGYGANLSIERF